VHAPTNYWKKKLEGRELLESLLSEPEFSALSALTPLLLQCLRSVNNIPSLSDEWWALHVPLLPYRTRLVDAAEKMQHAFL
jgi:hypothetical protein